MTPLWLGLPLVISVHHEQLAEHGGPVGIRDIGRLDAALSRPKNLLAYGSPDIFDLAACYGHGICQAHAFVDGNKRVGITAAGLFLQLNGRRLVASHAELESFTLSVARGETDQAGMAAWFEQQSEPYHG